MHGMTRPSAAAGLETLLARWRDDTPGCAHRNHLNNAGSALPPRALVGARPGCTSTGTSFSKIPS